MISGARITFQPNLLNFACITISCQVLDFPPDICNFVKHQGESEMSREPECLPPRRTSVDTYNYGLGCLGIKWMKIAPLLKQLSAVVKLQHLELPKYNIHEAFQTQTLSRLLCLFHLPKVTTPSFQVGKSSSCDTAWKCGRQRSGCTSFTGHQGPPKIKGNVCFQKTAPLVHRLRVVLQP